MTGRSAGEHARCPGVEAPRQSATVPSQNAAPFFSPRNLTKMRETFAESSYGLRSKEWPPGGAVFTVRRLLNLTRRGEESV